MPLHVNSPFTLALRNTEPLIDAKQTADPHSGSRSVTDAHTETHTGTQAIKCAICPEFTEHKHSRLQLNKSKISQIFPKLFPVFCKRLLGEEPENLTTNFTRMRHLGGNLQCPWLFRGVFGMHVCVRLH